MLKWYLECRTCNLTMVPSNPGGEPSAKERKWVSEHQLPCNVEVVLVPETEASPAESPRSSLSYVRVLCPDVVVHDLVADDSAPSRDLHVFLDHVIIGKQERLGKLVRSRRCGAYEVRLAHDPNIDAQEIIVSRDTGTGAAVMSYFADRSGCATRRFEQATEDDLRQALTPNQPGGGCNGFW